MRKKSNYDRRRGRRAGIAASFAALLSMLVVSIGAPAAQAQTKTAWIPLDCRVFGSVINHVAAALTATFPDTVAPGDTFSLTNVGTTVVLPPGSQNAGAAVFPGSTSFQGVNTDFETNLTNASANFAPATVGGVPATVVSSSPTQFNSVGAVQPPNQPASGNPHIDGGDTTRAGFQPSTPAGSFSFGDIPVKSPNPPPATANTYGPAPGLGGGPNPTDGTPDIIATIGPLTATGADGDTIVMKTANPGGPPAGNSGQPKVADNAVNFGPAYSAQAPADCALDGATTDNGNPNPGDGTGGTFTDQFTIPIQAAGPTDGVGSASARGTDPDASLGAGTVAAQFSAISNCDETLVKPFYVRWTSGGTNTFKKTGASDTSICFNSGGANINEGTGSGLVNGSTPATVSWHFADGAPDDAQITVTPDVGDPLDISVTPPDPLSGTPGGVWASGTLPWPTPAT